MDPSLARSTWHQLETINAVTYFCAECREAPARLGLRGFWMGYFACRAAPMGAVPAGVVEATFFNFHPDRVRRALPDAWNFAAPAAVVDARAEAAASALRRLLGDHDAEALAEDVRADLRATVESAAGSGRPLFAANRDLRFDDPVADLWQAATALREHRGDAHVALLTAAGLDGCEAHALFSATEGVDPALYQASRGWSVEDWGAALDRLAGRGLTAGDGEATDAGRALRAEIERRTDELAIEPYRRLGTERLQELLRALEPAVARIAGSAEIDYPNPMGLPRA